MRYYKRIIKGKVVELHTQEEKGDYILGNVFPESDKEEIFKSEEWVEVEIDEGLDEGIKEGIFKIT